MLAAPLVGPASAPDVPKGALAAARPAPRPKVTSDGRSAMVRPLAPVAGPIKGFDPKTSRELPAKRRERSRTYQNADGTQTTQTFQGRVNFRRKDGSWVPLDTTLVPRPVGGAGSAGTPSAHVLSPSSDAGTPSPVASPAGRAGSGWVEKSAELPLDLASYADDPSLASLELDAAHSVGYGISGAAHVVGQASGSTVTYPDVLADSDVRLFAEDGGVKEQLVLKSADAPSTWVFPLQLAGLRAQMMANGGVAFVDGAGVQQAYVPHGFMVDSKIGEHTGEGQRSDAVTYELTTVGGQPALRVQLDQGWLHDAARVFPVTVDPSVQKIGDSRDTYVMYPFTADYSGDTEAKIGTFDGGDHKAKAFLGFGSVGADLQNEYVEDADLFLYDSWSYSCKSAPVYVYPITESWSVSTTTHWPGPSTGAVLGSRSFAHGYRPDGSSSWACKQGWDSIDLGSAGDSLVNGWTHGTKANNGLAVGASTTSSSGYKRFTTRQNSASSAPQLSITYSKYGVGWPKSVTTTTPPSATQDGTVKITLKNLGTDTWTPTNGYKLGYTLYNSAGTLVATTPVWTTMPSSVAPNASVTVSANIAHVPAGTYVVDWNMYSGSTSFSSQGVPLMPMKLTIPDSPPAITGVFPPSGYAAATLTQQLSLTAYDPDSTGLSYDFKICKVSDSSACVDSGAISTPYWTPLAGQLVWNTAYTWTGKVTSGGSTTTVGPVELTPSVPQPPITQHLAAQSTGQAFDPQVGNYTTSATDAAVASAGPELSVVRTYNSLDPRTSGAFGAGWATRFDMRLVPDSDGSGNVVVTMADGHEVRFGKNPDGTFAPPVGDFATLTHNADDTYTLVDKTGSRYDFTANGALGKLTEATGLTQTYTYDAGLLSTVQNPISGRVLHFTWTGAHVTSVSTDPVDGNALTWNYTYDGDRLSQVCAPTSACTGYEYADGSHYRSAVIDSAPQSYYRLGDAEGTSAASEVDSNQGKDNGTYAGVTLGSGGALAGTTDTAATFDGTSSSVRLADGLISSNTYLSIELWFKTTSSGVLLSYMDQQVSGNPLKLTPALYVGTDGKLRGEFWNGTATPITTADTVNDGNWHHAVLTGAGTTQSLYLDGVLAGSLSGQINQLAMLYTYAGAGYVNAGWPATAPAKTLNHFTGSIDEVAIYPRPLGLPAIQAHYNLGRSPVSQLSKITLPSGHTAAQVSYDVGQDRIDTYTDANDGTWQPSTPAVTGADTTLTRGVTVTDPAGHPTTYSYDPLNNGRITAIQRDSNPALTYTYDSGGFLATQTDENGHTITLTHDARGNILSRTTCRTAGSCQTGYYSYYLNTGDPLDPRNDKMTASRDGRSTSATDTTYQTTYTYTTDGRLASLTTPATSDFPAGRTTTHTFTTGTEPADGGGTTPPGLPATDLTPGGKTTGYAYTSSGDLAQVTEPSGQKIRYTYDAIGRRLTATQITDAYPAGLTTTTTYTALSRPATITYPPLTDQVTNTVHTRRDTYTYDEDANTTAVTSADLTGGDADRTVAYEYDDHDRLSQTTDPEGAVTGYDYDDSGNLVHKTDPGDHEYAYTYNDRNQLTQTTLQNWSDDPNADPPSSQDLVTDSFAYDPAGRLASHTDAMGRTDTYTYFNDNLPATTTRQSTSGNLVTESDGYDAAGHLAQQITGGGKTETDYTIDAAGRTTTQVLDPAGLNRTTTTTYDADDDPTHVVYTGAGTGRTIDYTYDNGGNMASQAVSGDATTRLTTYTHDQRGLTTSITDPRGNAGGADPTAYTTDLAYDEAGNLTLTTAPPVQVEAYKVTATTARPTSRIGYDTFGDATAHVDGNGDTTTYTFDRAGRITKTTAPAYTPPGGGTAITPVTTYAYDDADNITSITDPAGNTTSYTYDAFGNPLTRTDPQLTTQTSPGVWTYTYDADSEQLSVTDPTGAQTQATYDDLGRQATTTDVVRGSSGTEYYTTTSQYDGAGNLLTQTSPLGVVTSYTYDAAAEPTSRADTLGNTSHTTYDLFGNPLKQTLPTGEGISYTYDAAGNATVYNELDRSGNVSHSRSYTYDLAGNPTTATDARNHTTTFTYNAINELTKQIEPVDSSTTITTNFGYDANGNRTRITDGRGNRTWTTYNTWNLPESVVEPATTATPSTADRTYTASYNALAKIATVSEPGGVTQTNTYDELGDLTQQTGTGADATTGDRQFAYDLAGRRLAAATPAGEDDFTYDDRGLLLSATGASGNSSFSYNADGAMTARTDASGTTAYGYDTDGRLATAADPITGRTDTYGYDTDSHLGTITYGASGPVRTLTWGQAGNLQSDTITNPTGQTIASTSYVYNPEHQIQTKTTTDYAGAGTTTYAYDWAGRLKSQTAGTTTTNYTFDASGNLTSDGTHTFTYDERDHLATDGTSTYTYTPRGTLASKTSGGQTTTYTADAFDQFATVGSAAYSYDALNRVIQRNGTNLAYSGTGNDLASDGTATYSRDTHADLIGVATNGHNSAAITDQNHDDLIAALDPATSTLNGSTSYDPYGNITATTGDKPAIGYQSGYTDPDTGQIDMHARWYNPATANFTSRDTITNNPTPDSANANPYTYAAGDPLDATDPTGHCPWCFLAELGADLVWDIVKPSPIWVPPCERNHTCGYVPPRSSGGGSSPGLELMPRRGITPKHRNTCWACLGLVGVGGGGGAGGVGVGAIGIVALPPPPADPCAHNHHCYVPPSPKVKPQYKPVDDIKDLKHLPKDTPEVKGTPTDPGPFPIPIPIADPTTGGGGGGIPGSNSTRDCTNQGQGWYAPSPLDWNNGNRPTGIVACINTPFLEEHPGSTADPNNRPVGYDWARRYARWNGAPPRSTVNACHLLADQLGGPGDDLRNLATCGRDANVFGEKSELGATDNMAQFENDIRRRVDKGQTVLYSVVPLYLGKRTVPMAFRMSSTFWVAGQYVGGATHNVRNMVNTPRGWVNLGTVIDSRTGADVPVS